MSQVNVIRAWKDEEYRNGLSGAERAALPENPAGLVELTEQEMAAGGGYIVYQSYLLSCYCHGLMF
jgi:mersacidin/lichenicidin family type 2 lantibiotic